MRADLERIRYLGDVQRLALKPTDIVVIKTHKPLSPSSLQEIKAMTDALFVANKVLVLEHGLDLTVVSPEDENT